jgi:hypothetical protein
MKDLNDLNASRCHVEHWQSVEKLFAESFDQTQSPS